EFTDPEILRTNLASVILQMTNIGLGDIAAFPFLDPPDRRAIADGINLLLEAERNGCLREVLIIAAGLSIQDPRERPTDHAAAADQFHARFADPTSDFLAYVNL